MDRLAENLDRRTGGLEISNHAVKATYTLDRRTGGLENYRFPLKVLEILDRRTGGLENEEQLLEPD